MALGQQEVVISQREFVEMYSLFRQMCFQVREFCSAHYHRLVAIVGRGALARPCQEGNIVSERGGKEERRSLATSRLLRQES